MKENHDTASLDYLYSHLKEKADVLQKRVCRQTASLHLPTSLSALILPTGHDNKPQKTQHVGIFNALAARLYWDPLWIRRANQGAGSLTLPAEFSGIEHRQTLVCTGMQAYKSPFLQVNPRRVLKINRPTFADLALAKKRYNSAHNSDFSKFDFFLGTSKSAAPLPP